MKLRKQLNKEEIIPKLAGLSPGAKIGTEAKNQKQEYFVSKSIQHKTKKTKASITKKAEKPKALNALKSLVIDVVGPSANSTNAVSSISSATASALNNPSGSSPANTFKNVPVKNVPHVIGNQIIVRTPNPKALSAPIGLPTNTGNTIIVGSGLPVPANTTGGTSRLAALKGLAGKALKSRSVLAIGSAAVGALATLLGYKLLSSPEEQAVPASEPESSAPTPTPSAQPTQPESTFSVPVVPMLIGGGVGSALGYLLSTLSKEEDPGKRRRKIITWMAASGVLGSLTPLAYQLLTHKK